MNLYSQFYVRRYAFSLGALERWGGAGMVKSILSSINVSTLRPPEGAEDGFFVVPSSDRRPAAI